MLPKDTELVELIGAFNITAPFTSKLPLRVVFPKTCKSVPMLVNELSLDNV